MIGDSTMAQKSESRFPETGWGQTMPQLVTENTTIHNHAVNGRSTKSFINEGRWAKVLDSIQPGDYVIIQFGHNDEKPDSARHTDPYTSFKDNLKRFATETQNKGAFPIICSSIVRRHFDEEGKLEDSHGDYIPAAEMAAKETQTPYINMETLTRQLVVKLGEEKSIELYNHCEPGQYPGFKNGKHDNTHLNVKGAKSVAEIFVKACKDKQLDIARTMK